MTSVTDFSGWHSRAEANADPRAAGAGGVQGTGVLIKLPLALEQTPVVHAAGEGQRRELVPAQQL